MGAMVFIELSYQLSGSRTVRITFASGKAVVISRQNRAPGQSVLELNPR
jgi:hypothetical protein